MVNGALSNGGVTPMPVVRNDYYHSESIQTCVGDVEVKMPNWGRGRP
ncbi:MAG: hypothetical protein ACTS73_03880 [Arsenophonus sp. NEOnobi-MAG3]